MEPEDYGGRVGQFVDERLDRRFVVEVALRADDEVGVDLARRSLDGPEFVLRRGVESEL